MSTKMRIRIGTITLLGLFVALGYRGEASAHTASVSISGFAFQPPTLNVAVGTTVQWVNHDTAAHTASSNTGAFDSGVLNQNGSYSFTFNQAGTFSYHCAIHPYMTGQIVVGAQAATSTSVPTSAPGPTLT